MEDVPERAAVLQQLIVLTGPTLGSVVRVVAPVFVIGRAEQAHMRVEAEGVSRRHACLQRDEQGAMQVVDLDSCNGTYVNGKRVTVAPLRGGDRLRVGREIEFEFRIEHPNDKDTVELGMDRAERSVEANLATALHNLARMHLLSGEFDAALQPLQRARAHIASRPDVLPDELAAIDIDLAECQLGLNHVPQAHALAQAALEQPTRGGLECRLLCRVRFVVARCVYGQEQARARELALMARAVLEDTDVLAVRIDAWLETSRR